MKKIFAAIIAVMMAVCLITVPSMADEPVVFSTDTITDADAGTDVVIDVTIEGNYEAHILNLQFDYDAEALSIVDIQRGEVINNASSIGGMVILDKDSIPGSIRLGIMMPMAPFTTEGTIYTVTFHIDENIPDGTELPLTIGVNEFNNFPPNGELTNIEHEVVNGAIIVGVLPTEAPTEEPTPEPTEVPTPEPTEEPTPEPTEVPTPEPTEVPTPEPTEEPTPEPTEVPEDVVFTLGETQYAEPGDQISVDLSISGDYAAHGLNLWLDFNNEYLTIDSIDYGEICEAINEVGGMIVLDYTTVPGSVRFGVLCPDEFFSGSGAFFTINFTVDENAPVGEELSFEILVNEFFNMPIGGENTPIEHVIDDSALIIITEAPETEVPVTEVPVTEVPTVDPTEVPVTEVPTVEPTEVPVTEVPTVDPTEVPVTEEPIEVTPEPEDPGVPPTGALSLVGVGIMSIVAGAGVVLFKKRR